MASSSLVFAMAHQHHPNNLRMKCGPLCVSGLVMGFLLLEEGSGNKDLRVVVRLNFLFQVFVRWPPVLN